MFREISVGLCLFLQSVVSHDVGPAPGPCLAGATYEDGTSVAVCIGPARDLISDRDGQLYVNLDGNAMALPGWVEAK